MCMLSIVLHAWDCHWGQPTGLACTCGHGVCLRAQGLRACNVLEGGVTPLHTAEELKVRASLMPG